MTFYSTSAPDVPYIPQTSATSGPAQLLLLGVGRGRCLPEHAPQGRDRADAMIGGFLNSEEIQEMSDVRL
jgi:hypothetical protein